MKFMPNELNGGQNVTLGFTAAEALVLFELLARWEETDAACVPLEHQAEHRVLWNTLAMWERILAEPFMPDYQDWLDRARELVRDKEE